MCCCLVALSDRREDFDGLESTGIVDQSKEDTVSITFLLSARLSKDDAGPGGEDAECYLK